jgi:hydroxyacylglutathione hydrolase
VTEPRTPVEVGGEILDAQPLDVRWIHGSPSAKHDTDPDIQVHSYDEHTVILRQNMAIKL